MELHDSGSSGPSQVTRLIQPRAADVVVSNLVRAYPGTSSPAVDDISFRVEHGETFGILGPNGAGKTTTIKILMTLLLPTSGAASVLGYDVVRDARDVRRHIGYVLGGERGFFDRLSASDNLKYFGSLYNLPRRALRQRIEDVLSLVGLADRANERVERYSRGMKQRLHIARSLLHDPPIMFFDEPTVGIDPVGARSLRDLISSLSSAGKTCILTTHYMIEAEELCDRLVLIQGGQIVSSGTPQEVLASSRLQRVISLDIIGTPRVDVDALQELDNVNDVKLSLDGEIQSLEVWTTVDADCLGRVLACLSSYHIERVSYREPTLEDAYVSLVTRDTPPGR